jgi:hypothetical protein
MRLIQIAVRTDQFLMPYKGNPLKFILLMGLCLTPIGHTLGCLWAWSKSYKFLHTRRAYGSAWASRILFTVEAALVTGFLLLCDVADTETTEVSAPTFLHVGYCIVGAYYLYKLVRRLRRGTSAKGVALLKVTQ